MRRDALRSIRSCSRAYTRNERGFALVAAVVLVLLYVALVELLLMDSSRELNEARRFRAKVIAATLAENGAELAALHIVTQGSSSPSAQDGQGSIRGTMSKTPGGLNQDDSFVLTGTGTTTGIVETTAYVELKGRITGTPKTQLKIDYSVHTP